MVKLKNQQVMFTEEDFLRITKYAVKAPSSHNTQPWFFMRESDGLVIRPDLSRALPVVDPDNHALFISLGCAVENAVIAATHFGFSTRVSLLPADASAEGHMGDRGAGSAVGSGGIRIEISDRQERGPHPLFGYLGSRQVTRGKYDDQPLSPVTLESLKEVPMEPGIALQVIERAAFLEQLLPLVIEGSDLQFGNKKFVNELVSWIRFSDREAMKKGDGIRNASMGMPGVGRLIGSFIMKHLVSTGSEAKRWKKLMHHSGAFVLFTTERNDPEGWINLGRSFQRFGLETTRMGLKHAHLNMPLEEEAVREKVAGMLGLKGSVPLLLLRLGHVEPAPYAFRRQLHEVLVEK